MFFDDDQMLDDLEEAALRAVLAAGRLTFDQLAASPEIAEILAEYGLKPGDIADEAVDEALLYSSAVVVDTESDQVDAASAIWEGRTLTHRLSAEEADTLTIDHFRELIHLADDSLRSTELRFRAAGTDETPAALPRGVEWDLSGLFAGIDRSHLRSGSLIAATRRGEVIEIGPVDEPEESGVAATALAGTISARDSTIGFELHREPAITVLREPDAFLAATIPLSELMESIGFSRHGHWYGPADADWETPGALRAKQDAAFRRSEYGFDAAAEAQFQVASQAWGDVILERPNSTTALELTTSLAHPEVFDAVWEDITQFGIRPELIVDFIGDAATGPQRRTAYPKAMLGLAVEAQDPLAAELHFKAALLCDPSCHTAHLRLGIMCIDRADYPAAVRHLQAFGGSQIGPIVASLQDAVSASDSVGRNDPCPCGSGRKFKKCHQGTAMPGDSSPFRLADRLTVFQSINQMHVVNELSEVAGVAPDSFIDDLALFEGGGIGEYLDQRSMLIPQTDQDALATWIAADREVYEVTETTPGFGVSVRNVASGAIHEPRDQSMSISVVPGDYYLLRIAFGPEPIVVGTALSVPLHALESALTLQDQQPDEFQLARWYGQLLAPPRLSNREGHVMEPRFIAVQIDTPIDDTTAWLDTVATREGTVWNWSKELSEHESLITATMTIDDPADEDCIYLVFEVNSAERADEVLATILDQHPGALVVTDDRIGLEEMSGPGVSSAPMDLSEGQLSDMLAEYMAGYSAEWIDMEIPALGGLTPRQAADDPTRRDDLRRLLRQMPTGAGGMDGVSIAKQLGIDV